MPFLTRIMLGYSKMTRNSYSKFFVFESHSFVLMIRNYSYYELLCKDYLYKKILKTKVIFSVYYSKYINGS